MSTAHATPTPGDVIDINSRRGATVMDRPQEAMALPSRSTRSKRAAARWARRQATTDGGVPRIFRGSRRVGRWIVGAEGEQAAAARRYARALASDASKAALRAQVGFKDRDVKKQLAGEAKAAAEVAIVQAERATKRARIAAGVRAGLVLAPTAAVDITAYAAADTLGLAGAGALTLWGLARAGRQRRHEDEPVIVQGEVIEAEPQSDVLGEEMLTEAFAAAGIIKAGQRISLVAPPARDRVADATTLLLDLPAGLTADVAIPKRKALASALGVDESQVHIERVRGSARRLSVWLMDEDPFERPPARSPLLDADQVTLWDAIPVGTDTRGRPVPLGLVDASILIAGEPRAGKTVATNAIIGAAALAPHVRLHLFDGKGAGDHRPWRSIAHTAIKRNPKALREHLLWLQAEMERVFDLLDDQGADSKLTPELCEELGVDVELTVVDETRFYLTDRKYGAEIVDLCVDIASRGPAAGKLLVLASQRMTVDAIPGPLRGVCSLRWAMRCPDATASNAVLGEGKAGKGWDASDIARDQRGVGILDAEGETPILLRSYLLAGQDPYTIAGKARALRAAAGTLPDSDSNADSTDDGILTLMLDAFAKAGNPDRMKTADILAGLAVMASETWSPEALGVAADDAQGLARVGGRRLAEEITTALDGTDRELTAKAWTAGERGRGYYLADVKAAAGIA